MNDDPIEMYFQHYTLRKAPRPPKKKRKRNKKEGVVLGIPVRAAPTTLEDETHI